MKLAYDSQAGALYIELAGHCGGAVRTVAVDDGTNVDLDAAGHLLGIEVLNPGSFWPVAEILARWEVGRDDQAMIMAMYPFGYPVQVA